jgi:hypothetical protein
MSFIVNIGKKILFWTYSRTSWQWDVLCVLILVFIFLTPKSWFANKTTVVIGTDVVGTQLDRGEIERRAKQISVKDGTVAAVRERRDSEGRLIAYEVDIR